MKHTFLARAAELLRADSKRKRWYRALSGMAAVVVFVTTYMLILPAITMESDTACGMAEHTHTDACYELQLVCTQAEGAGEHVHTDACYQQQQVLTCTQAEGAAHVHGAECYTLTCTEEGAGHTHTDACYDTVEELTCAQAETEGHTHGDGCYDDAGALVCTEAEGEGHTHGDGCYTQSSVLTCTQAEEAGHTHTDACYTLTCTQAEGEGHTHTEACYTTELVPVCTETAGHVHTDACYEKVLVCTVPEHVHTDECYQQPEPAGECDVPEHIHTDACYDESGALICTLTEHTHGEDCLVEIPEELPPLAAFPQELPEGYADYAFENETGLSVLVYAPEAAFDREVSLFAEQLLEDSEGYAQAQMNLDAAEEMEYEGFVALDIRFEDADGVEVEPDPAAGEVYVKIDAKALLPEGVDPETVAVQHHVAAGEAAAEELVDTETGLTVVPVEVVADQSQETGSVVVTPSVLPEIMPLALMTAEVPEEQPDAAAMDVEAEFTVESFSTFTITWKSESGLDSWSVTIHTVDQDTGFELDANVTNIGGLPSEEEVVLKDCAPNITGYRYVSAAIGSRQGTPIYSIQASRPYFQGWDIQYKQSGNSKWETYPGGSIYLLYEYVGSTLPTVNTEDTITKNITINLFNYDGIDRYNNLDREFNLNTTVEGGDSWTGSGNGVRQGLVQKLLSADGYPVLTRRDNKTLATLFDPDTRVGTTLDPLQSYDNTVRVTGSYPNANHLFQKDEDGYYWYDSAKHYAYYNQNGSNKGNFTVYQNPLTTSEDPAQPKFLPFNTVVPDAASLTGMKLAGSYDYHFGMSVGFDFMMPYEGKVGDQNMKFEFAGDDDVWVFIDGVLVLDMGGIHDNFNGYIDFAYTEQGERVGQVYVEKVDGSSRQYWTIKEMFEAAGKTWDSSDFATHTFDFFYMERGSGGSNCKIKFNLPAVAKNSLMVGKQLAAGNTSSEIEDYVKNSLDYTFQVLKAVNGAATNQSIFEDGTSFKIQSVDGHEVGTGTVQDGKFTLKAGQIAVFEGAMAENSGDYIVRETLPNNYKGQYEGVGYEVSSGGGKAEIDGKNEETFTSFDTDILHATAKSTTVTFTNRVDMTKLSLLNISKVAAPGSAIQPDDTFPILVKLNGEDLKEGTEYVLTQVGGGTQNLTVGADGIIPLKAGETAALVDGILVGTQFQIMEQNEDGRYVVTYAGTVSPEDPEWSVTDMTDPDSGEVIGVQGQITQMGSVVSVQVTNADYDFPAVIPMEKTLLGGQGKENHTFYFQVQRVNSDTDLTVAEDLPDAWVTTTGDFGAGGVYIGFVSAEERAGNTYWYKITERTGTDESISYDASCYLAQVTIQQGTDGLEAAVTGVQRYLPDGQQDTSFVWGAQQKITFTNSKGGDLAITKQVARTDGGEDRSGDFTFQITLPAEYVGKSYQAQFSTAPERPAETLAFTAGSDGRAVAAVTLHHSETVTIQDLPVNIQPEIQELNSAGYSIEWAGNTATGKAVSGDTVTTAAIGGEVVSVTCTNTTGAVLPSTGGMGIVPFMTFGALLMLGAGVLLMIQRRRREGRDAC